MAAFLVMMICLSVAVPFTVMAWAMKRTHCPQCGAEVGPDADLMRILGG
jgi:hypothetical protein